MTLKKAHELADGGIITEAGNSEQFHTGDWREERPVFIPDNCINCLFCWIYCPDMSIKIEKDDSGKKITRIRHEIRLPEGFPEKYEKALVRAADTCSVKRYLKDPPAVETVTVKG